MNEKLSHPEPSSKNSFYSPIVDADIAMNDLFFQNAKAMEPGYIAKAILNPPKSWVHFLEYRMSPNQIKKMGYQMDKHHLDEGIDIKYHPALTTSHRVSEERLQMLWKRAKKGIILRQLQVIDPSNDYSLPEQEELNTGDVELPPIEHAERLQAFYDDPVHAQRLWEMKEAANVVKDTMSFRPISPIKHVSHLWRSTRSDRYIIGLQEKFKKDPILMHFLDVPFSGTELKYYFDLDFLHDPANKEEIARTIKNIVVQIVEDRLREKDLPLPFGIR